MKYLGIAIVYASFFAAISTAVYVTKSGLPLFALMLTPSLRINGSKKKSKKQDKSNE